MIELHGVNSGKRVSVNPQFVTAVKEEIGGATIWLADAGIGRQVAESYDEIIRRLRYDILENERYEATSSSSDN